LVITAGVALTSPSCEIRQRSLCANTFEPAPHGLLAQGQIEFNRLGTAKLSLVRITPTRARDIADHTYGRGHGSRVVLESLGGYIDKDQIVPDWVGTKSWVPKAVPAYLVRIHEAYVVTVDPSHNHYWNVIVNAVSGKIISAISYD
jgi:hypothetical protein